MAAIAKILCSREVPFICTSSPLYLIYEIDEYISYCQCFLSTHPRSHPLHFSWLLALAGARLRRNHISGHERDLDTSILLFTYSILFPFHFSAEGGLNTFDALCLLTDALFYRASKYVHRQPDDVKHCVKYLRFLRDRSLWHLVTEHNCSKALLVRALALRLPSEPSHVLQDVEEMSVLCRELLASGLSEPELNLKDILANFTGAIAYGIKLGNQPSQQVIECLHEVSVRLPDLEAIRWVFASLHRRVHEPESTSDYEDVMGTLDKIIASHSTASAPNQYVKQTLDLSAELAHSQLTKYGNPEHLEEAIFRYRAHLRSMSPDDPQRPTITNFLTRFERRRFNEFGVKSGPPEARSNDPEALDLTSFSNLVESFVKSNAVSPNSTTAEDRARVAKAVHSLYRITDTADIEEAIEHCRLLLRSLQPTDSLTPLTAVVLGTLLLHASRRLKNIQYLNESITLHRDILEMPGARFLRVRLYIIWRFISCLFFRFLLSHDIRDIDEAMRLYPIAATDTYATVPDRFNISCEWAKTARAYGHQSTSTAYDIAISLMQDTLAFGPTLEIQHFRLIERRDDYERLSLDRASYQVLMGQLEQAIETLERGRGLLWSEMRGLRTSKNQLDSLIHRPLAEKFAAVNRELETLTTSIPPGAWVNNDSAGWREEMDPFGRLVVQQRKLFDERNTLIMQIRTLPGFESFLMAPSFDALRSAAACGPVIIINHCEWRSDIIILLYDYPPSLVPVANDFYARAITIREVLFEARRKGLESKEYADALSFVLKSLYDFVGRPVIARLRELNVSEQSRVWWCPTSVFFSLPLHAMGPIRSDGHVKLYFSDLYIPSYTLSLSALIEARKPGAKTFDKPSILLVAQPSDKLPKVLQEMRVVQAVSPSVTTLIRETATPAAVLEHLKNHRFVHISCHTKLEAGKPFDTSLELYEGAHLTLLDVVRSQLPTAEFAFLSTCHSAELTEGSIADEGLHLTGAVQNCGFRSVVGTMWAMADVDGPDLAWDFYRSLFSDKWHEKLYFERTAEALRDAVRGLRRKRNMTLERWVNFIHYGA